MMFYIFVGLEILTKNAQTRCSLFIFVLLGFSFNANAQFGFSHEGCNSWTCGFSIGLWTAV
jgi:hypothetical protein